MARGLEPLSTQLSPGFYCWSATITSRSLIYWTGDWPSQFSPSYSGRYFLGNLATTV